MALRRRSCKVRSKNSVFYRGDLRTFLPTRKEEDEGPDRPRLGSIERYSRADEVGGGVPV